MKNPDIYFEKFQYQKELTEQRKLFIECFPETIGTPVETIKHYEWKFKSFPSQYPSYEYVAKSEDEMIGYYAAIPYEYNIKGKNVQVAMVCDVMTGIKARGKGVFTKLGVYSTDQFKEEGLAFSTGYPIRAEVIPGHKKAGWTIPFQIPMYGKFVRMDSFLRSRNKQFLIPPANLLLSLGNFIFRIFSHSSSKNITVDSYTSSEIETIDGLDIFFSEWKNENIISLNKSIKFLKWRLGAPEKEYHILILRERNKIVGYSIFRNVNKENVPCIGVLDFSLLHPYRKYATFLLNQIEKIAKKEKAELILMMMMKEKAKIFRIYRNGYMKTPYPFSFIIKQFDDLLDGRILKNEKNWNLMWIDSDDL